VEDLGGLLDHHRLPAEPGEVSRPPRWRRGRPGLGRGRLALYALILVLVLGAVGWLFLRGR
jgi:hypothetical protein